MKFGRVIKSRIKGKGMRVGVGGKGDDEEGIIQEE